MAAVIDCVVFVVTFTKLATPVLVTLRLSSGVPPTTSRKSTFPAPEVTVSVWPPSTVPFTSTAPPLVFSVTASSRLTLPVSVRALFVVVYVPFRLIVVAVIDCVVFVVTFNTVTSFALVTLKLCSFVALPTWSAKLTFPVPAVTVRAWVPSTAPVMLKCPPPPPVLSVAPPLSVTVSLIMRSAPAVVMFAPSVVGPSSVIEASPVPVIAPMTLIEPLPGRIVSGSWNVVVLIVTT